MTVRSNGGRGTITRRLTHARRWCAIGVCALVSGLAASPRAIAAPLDREVSTTFSNAKLGQAAVGVCVMDTQTGEVLASMNERQSFVPASNLKLLTSGAALMVLGKDYQFRTKLMIVGDKLVIQGAGDPGLADPKLLDEMKVSLDALLEQLAGQVAKSGAKNIKEIVVDDRIFDRDSIHPSWPKDQLNQWYAAEVSGLNFYTNCLEVYAQRGTKAGAPPAIRTVPSAPWIEILNKARTIDEGQTALGATRDGESTRFTLAGTVRATLDEPIEVTVHEPGLIFARLMADRLVSMGVMASAAPVVRLAQDGEQLAEGRTVSIISTKLPTALQRCNVDSQNLYAECLLKAIGHAVTGQPGSWSNGSTVLRMTIKEQLGVDSGETVIADGSGLSKDNRVTPYLMASWLSHMAKNKDLAETFVASMADADEGRLATRFKDRKLRNTVHAKTGYIKNVLCLSGYVTSPKTGRRLAFSVLVNNFNEGTSAGKVKEFHEDVVAIADRWLAKQDGAAVPSAVPEKQR